MAQFTKCDRCGANSMTDQWQPTHISLSPVREVKYLIYSDIVVDKDLCPDCTQVVLKALASDDKT